MPTVTDADVVIVGSGPVGSVFAGVVCASTPGARVVVVDVGPRLTAVPGDHVRNIRDGRSRRAAQRRSEGPVGSRARSRDGVRPGTFPIGPDVPRSFPAGAMSANVGGMGAHWTGATPYPDRDEQIPFLDPDRWGSALRTAAALLDVGCSAFPSSPVRRHVCDRLSAAYPELPPDRSVQVMPVAGGRRPGRLWWGPGALLGRLLDAHPRTFEIRSSTLCRRIHVADGVAVSAELEDRRTSVVTDLRARAFVVAADAIRTPQLLWASGLRPPALGRFLNDHVQILSALHAPYPATAATPGDDDATADMVWLPYSRDHACHGQIMTFARFRSPDGRRYGGTDGSVVGLGWLVPTAAHSGNRVTFDDRHLDPYGMPCATVEYVRQDSDHDGVASAISDQHRVADALGWPFVAGCLPEVQAPGSSLHYQGTFRMGAVDDGSSVCDPDGSLWSVPNIHLGGNGVVPTVTAGNPTLFSCALAVLSARRLADRIAGR